MNRQRERIRREVRTEHLMQLFDDARSRAETVAEFLFEGWQRGEPLLVVARPETWARTSRELVARGCPVDEVISSARLVVLDAAATLEPILRNGQPVAERFRTQVSAVVNRMHAESGSPLRIYGEMVDILAAQGEFAAAHALEPLWNDLGASCSFTLLCGYASGHFGDARTTNVLRAICKEHDRATAEPNDLLGSWLLAERRSPAETQPRPGSSMR